jgi:hypothetical protein
MELIVKQFGENGIQFQVINGEVYANATLMCKAFGKRPIDWSRLPQTERYLIALKSKCENLTLIESRQGGNEAGTWIHEKLILKLAQWLDVDFEIWCDEQIATLLKEGKVESKPVFQVPTTYIEALEKLIETEKEKQFLLTKTENLETVLDNLLEWVSIIKVARFNKVSENQFNWRLLKAKSHELGYVVKKAESPRFGFQNLYHVDCFKAVYPQFNYNLKD